MMTYPEPTSPAYTSPEDDLIVCPKCRSSDVEIFLAGFFKANETGDLNNDCQDLSVADLYSDIYWCPECEEHPPHLIRESTGETW